jgi:hypothetical protein
VGELGAQSASESKRVCEKGEREKNKKCESTTANKAVEAKVRAGAVNWSRPWECVPEFC